MNLTRERLFRDTVFGPWLDIQSYENDSHLMQYVLQHQVYVFNIRSDCPPIIFQIGDHWLEFGRKEFCLITGFRFGQVSEKHGAMSPFFNQLFPEIKTIRGFKRLNGFDLLRVLRDKNSWLNMLDADAVRLCLLIVGELVFMGKEKRNTLNKHIMWLVDDLDAWNSYPWGEYMWVKFYKRTVNVVAIHTAHHLAEMKKTQNSMQHTIYTGLLGHSSPVGVLVVNGDNFWERGSELSKLSVTLISTPGEMTQAWFRASVEFIKDLAYHDGNFLQDNVQGMNVFQCDEARDNEGDGVLVDHNGQGGHLKDGNFVEVLDEIVGQNSNPVSVEEGDGVLDSDVDAFHLS
ncbi:phospholipase-like protein [Tanacetum coccineum]